MPNYRRLLVPGACWFFTVNLLDRSSCLLVERADDSNRIVWKVQQQRPFHIDAWVVLPEHLHAIWSQGPERIEVVAHDSILPVFRSAACSTLCSAVCSTVCSAGIGGRSSLEANR